MKLFILLIMPDTIVLGLDGANWDLLKPWVESGALPNIQSLKSSGVYMDSESCLPPVTCPNWRCYSTGKNPGKLGVFWWDSIDTASRSLSTPDATSFKSADYWDYLNDEGYDVGIFNLPMSYPPSEVADYMIAGGPGSKKENYAFPLELENKLDKKGYRLHPEKPVTSKKEIKEAEIVIDLIDERLTVFRDLLKDHPVDAAHCTIFYINTLQHFFWREEPTKKAWKIIDDHIGEIRSEYPDTTIMLMSDHGCDKIDTVFYANSWLEKNGYLKTKDDISGSISKTGINRRKISQILRKLGVHGIVKDLTPDRIIASIPQDAEGFKRGQKIEKIDWANSSAVASGQGLIYMIDDSQEILEEIKSELKSLTTTNGKHIAKEVYSGVDFYNGQYVDKAPEIIFEQASGVHTSGAIGANPVFSDRGQWEAENVRTGLFLADGPSVTSNFDGKVISITDIAPTILHHFDCGIPTDMDGKVIPILESQNINMREPIENENLSKNVDRDIQQRLENLGYLE